MTGPDLLNSSRMRLDLILYPRPALCTTALLEVDSPPMNIDIPTTPSFPTIAISAEEPFSSE
jgi:hypothetical protein